MRPGAYAVLPLRDRFLTVFQSGENSELMLPGGGIDPGESPIQTLHREVLEETGWRIARPRRLGAFRRFTFMPEYDLWAEKLCHIYVAHPVRKVAHIKEPDHHPRWLTAGAAIAQIDNDGDRLFLKRYIAGTGPRYSKSTADTSSGKSVFPA
ncbi:MAG: NUDIX hydrolase [Pseudomonadota bacterium]